MAMTRDQLIEKLIAYAADDYTETQRSFVEGCVDSAIEEVINEMCPWDISADAYEMLRQKALKRYGWNINRIAQFHYDKQGKEGVTTFYESGQTTSFSGGGTPKELFNGIVAIAKVV